MTATEDLERAYRRWVRLYPKSFRREHEEELVAVLLAGTVDGKSRPELVECLDLLSSALRMHLRPRVARSNRLVLNAVKLMYLGAMLELGAAVIIVATVADVKSSAFRSIPGYTENEWHAAVAVQIAPNAIGAVLSVAFWLWMARSIPCGHRWTRFAFAIFFALNVYGLLNGLVTGAAMYAQPDLAIAMVLCLVEAAAVAVLFRAKIAPTESVASQ